MHSVVFDTDIGTDVDDALAFAMLLGSPDVDLLGVTTVYGDTVLRARLARRYAALAHRQIRVFAGVADTLSGREVWWAGHEGSLHDGLEEERYEGEGAVDFLVRSVAARPGEIDVIAVGPLTNIATAITVDPHFAQNVKHLWVMGGSFAGVPDTRGDEDEHNFRSDLTAARIVFGSGIRSTVAGLETTQQVEIGVDGLDRIGKAGGLGEALEADIQQWWRFWNEQWNVPHDPVTVLSLLEPHLVTLSEPGVVTFGDDPLTGTISTFVADAAGPTRLVATLDPAAVAERIVALIERAVPRS